VINQHYEARDFQALDQLPPDLIDSASGVMTALFADRGLTYSDNSFYRARLMSDAVISQSAFDILAMGGRIGLTAAQLDLWNGDRALDNMAALGLLTGRTVKVRAVPAPSRSASDAGSSLSSAVTAFQGVAGSLIPNGQRMQLNLDDLSWRLSKPLQANRYDGSGGLNGTPDLAGKPKPVSFGWRYNVTPQPIGLVDLGDGAKLTYQTHWRPIAGHDAMRERGVPMTQTTSAPSIGEWKDWPVQGCFQLGFTPNGAVSCDVRGDAVGSYAGTTVQVVQRMLTTLGPLFADTDFDLGSLGLLETQILGEIGWGIGAESITAADAISQLVSGAGIWLIGNRKGQLRLAMPQPLAGVQNLSLDVGDIVSLSPLQLPATLQPAPSTVEVAAVKNWTPLSDISSSVSAADRSLLSGESQIVRQFSNAIGGRQYQQRTMSLPGLFRYTTDAQRRAFALSAWLEKGLRAFTVTTDKYLNQVEIGHVASVTYPLFGLQNGFTGVVAAWSEQVGKRRITMTLVG
jgi:hypothetical protein